MNPDILSSSLKKSRQANPLRFPYVTYIRGYLIVWSSTEKLGCSCLKPKKMYWQRERFQPNSVPTGKKSVIRPVSAMSTVSLDLHHTFDYLIVGSEERVVDSEQNVLPLAHDFCNPDNVTQTDQRVKWSLEEVQL
jgi:hypothetical protein